MQYLTIATLADLEALLADESTHATALAYLQALMDEQYGYDATGAWGLAAGGGLERLGVTRAEAVALGAVDQVVPEPARPTLEAARALKLAEIRVACNAALDPLAVSYPSHEVQSWQQQVVEAQALEVDPNASAPLVRAMAAMRPSLGGTEEDRVSELARRIRANAADWSAVAGPIIGRRQALEDQALAATTPAEVMAIVVDFSGDMA